MFLRCAQICLFMLLINISWVNADDAVPVCPPTIQVEQNVTPPDGDWREYDSRPRHMFSNVMFSEGEPSRHVILAPTRQEKKGRKQIDTWLFTASDTGYWLSCEYTGTSMVLFKKLPDNVKSCVVEYDMKFSTPMAKQVKCKP